MKKRGLFLLIAAVLSIGMIFAEGTPEDKMMMSPPSVMLKSGTVGPYLADEAGMTLYWYTRDSVNMSACTGNCVVNWPLFYVEKITVPSGLKASDFGTITRADGQKQTTFRGYPLYYYIKDMQPGDVTGEAVGGVWYVVDPAKFMVGVM